MRWLQLPSGRTGAVTIMPFLLGVGVGIMLSGRSGGPFLGSVSGSVNIPFNGGSTPDGRGGHPYPDTNAYGVLYPHPTVLPSSGAPGSRSGKTGDNAAAAGASRGAAAAAVASHLEDGAVGERVATEEMRGGASRRPMSGASLVIAGCAKDIHGSWNDQVGKRKIGVLQRVAAAFGSVRVLVFENDSGDGTATWLGNLSAAMGPAVRVEIISETGLAPWARPHGWGRRTELLAHARNRVLAQLETWASPPDYMLWLDLDDVLLGLDADALATCDANLPAGWGGCCANQRDFYYDLFALRTVDEWVNCSVMSDCDPQCRALGDTHGPGKTTAALACHAEAKERRTRHIAPEHPPIEVLSCFGGAALYDYRVIRGAVQRGAKYFGMMNLATGVGGGGFDVGRAGTCTPGVDCPDPSLEVVCEHVGWHASLRSHTPAFKLYINPRLLNTFCKGSNCDWEKVKDPKYRYGADGDGGGGRR